MSVGMTAEREELARSVHGFLSERTPMAEVRRLMADTTGYDAAIWRQMGQQFALQGIAVPEEYGGAGYGYAELAVVFEQMGRTLLPSPFFATVALALPALLAAGDSDALREYAPGLAAGESVATLAWVEDDGAWRGGTATTATHSGDTWTIEGHKAYVLDGAAADLILVIAEAPEGRSLFAVSADATGLTRQATPSFDQTRRLARIELHGSPARLVGEAGRGDEILAAALDRAAVLLAAEMVGGAQACLDMSVEYAKQREQFGRPIGSFQAIKHKCAEILVELEGARAAAYYGGWAADSSPAELPLVASVAKATASEAFFRAAAENVQIHGGIGVTWEYDAHLYLKRAKTSSVLLGDPGFHRQRLADLLEL
jgi:alkylation response protein AidB-like acyl-CoA dehydrogenase